jgi:hypothetical protein
LARFGLNGSTSAACQGKRGKTRTMILRRQRDMTQRIHCGALSGQAHATTIPQRDRCCFRPASTGSLTRSMTPSRAGEPIPKASIQQPRVQPARPRAQGDRLSLCLRWLKALKQEPVQPAHSQQDSMRCAGFHETRSVAVCLLRAALINRAFIASVEAGVPSLNVPNHLSRGKTPSAP